MSIDTLAIARGLRAAELPQQQAEAIATAIGSSIVDAAATKADIVELRGDVAKIRSDIRGDLSDLKATMMTWSIGTIITVTALAVAIIKL